MLRTFDKEVLKGGVPVPVNSSEWAAIIAATAAVVSSMATGITTYYITRRSIKATADTAEDQRKNDNDQREKDRQWDMLRERKLRMISERLEVSKEFLTYVGTHSNMAISVAESVLAGNAKKSDTSALDRLITDPATAGVRLIMPKNVVEDALRFVRVLGDLSSELEESLNVMNNEEDEQERQQRIRSAVKTLGTSVREVNDDMRIVIQEDLAQKEAMVVAAESGAHAI